MDDLNRMFIEHECSKLMTRYAHHLDHGEVEAFAELWTVDGMYKPAALAEPLRGREAILQWARAYPTHRLARHLATNHLVNVLDVDSATGRSYSVVFREPDPRPDEVSDRVVPRGVVEYFDTFRRTAQGWRFKSRYYQVSFMDPEETMRPLPWTPGSED